MNSLSSPTGRHDRGGTPILLVLEDGTAFEGRATGTAHEAFGEVVFNTASTGYQEVLTDPSYREQIVLMTYPEIGIYGINNEDVESNDVQVAALVVHRAIRAPSNHRATASLVDGLNDRRIPMIEGVDTRAVTRRIRSRGAMRGGISTASREQVLERVRAQPLLAGRDLASGAACAGSMRAVRRKAGALRIVLVDAGAKAGIERALARAASTEIDMIRVRCDASPSAVLALDPSGVILSNGPGDPAAVAPAIDLARSMLERRIPFAGVCLGHQILCLALGGATYKMRFGHRGTNHPVRDVEAGRVMITSQNHGFAVDPTSLGIPWAPLDDAFEPRRPELVADSMHSPNGRTTMAQRLPSNRLLGASPLGLGMVEATHFSLNDGTLEGVRLLDRPAMSVQFHPEASPGPHDAAGFFDDFLRIVEVRRG